MKKKNHKLNTSLTNPQLGSNSLSIFNLNQRKVLKHKKKDVM